ncbi:hypothetical protein GON26_09820 [Flavobacterium sp. GA093]|uniref:Uncharacterized protein n=1 Tax=Flavobacterium hydrocarbonoxydans TaxID=2683249 RepID=A0A6I4NJT3_9FLAO|nr:hypothetical protein [Flavobacterium hydrocarbonoxydans]MWB94660.1 hypothetical protein [Flavobacterium hydrocarbonoxydans]
MKLKIILTLIFLGLLIQCKKENPKNVNPKTEQITALNIYNYIGKSSMKFQLFSDSSYVFTIMQKDFDYEKLERRKGFCYLKNDTLYFKPLDFKFNRSEKAVIKNNFIEFVDGETPLKIEIRKNIFHTKSKLDLKKFNDYAFFTFNPEFQRPGNYGYKPETIKPADLNQSELIELDQILEKCFSENESKLKKLDKYVKQCIVVINEKHEKEIWIGCYCKEPYDNQSYKYSLIDMSDGGNCNIHLKINLTTHKYSDLNISGRA